MPVRLTALELPARWSSPAVQVAQVSRLVAAGSTDVLLLPEASFTGYVSPALDFNLRPQAVPLAQGVEALQALAVALACDVVGPVIEREGSRCFNAMVGVGPDGAPWLHYRKRHPWFPETWASRGDLPFPLVERHGLTFTMGICFDVHFLAAEAARELTEADVLLFPSAWVSDEADTKVTLLTDLATSFELTVLNANWGVGEPPIVGQGGSMVALADRTIERIVVGAARLDVRLG